MVGIFTAIHQFIHPTEYELRRQKFGRKNDTYRIGAGEGKLLKMMDVLKNCALGDHPDLLFLLFNPYTSHISF